MVVILVDNEEVRLVYNFKEFDALSFNRLVPSVPDLGGILSRDSRVLGPSVPDLGGSLSRQPSTRVAYARKKSRLGYSVL
jgi:hypothetical protein